MNLSIEIISTSISAIMLILVILWFFSEIWIAKDCKNNKKISSASWLILNLLLPFIGLIFYKFSTSKNN